MRFIFILFIIFAGYSYADEPQSALDKDPSVDASAQQVPTPSTVRPPAPGASSTKPNQDQPAMPQDQTGYVYDLKRLIVKSRENIKRVNEKIKEQAVMKRNQKREERAREYYQRGLQLSDEGKLDEAREYFEKAVRITEHPEMTKYIQKSEYRLKAQAAALRKEEKQQLHQEQADESARQQEARETYDAAVRFYKEKKYKEAKDNFERVDELLPDYKATRSYLKIIDQDIIAAEALAQQQQKKEMERQQGEAETARQREKEQWRKEIDRKEKERHDQVDQQARDVYEEAVKLYKAKKFAEAKKKFEQVEWVIPGYKATRSYLERADKDTAEEAKRVEDQKAKELAQQHWEDMVDQRKKEAAQKKASEQKEKEQRAQLEEQASFLYEAAVTLYNQKSLEESLAKFNDIEKIVPDYKSTRSYIEKISKLRGVAKPTFQAAPVPAPAGVAAPSLLAQIKSSKEEQIEQAKEIAQLAEQSQLMYQQIALLANDRRIIPAKRKMAEVDQVLNRLKAQKERLLQQITDDEERARQKALKQQQEEARAKAQESYDEAILLLRQKKFEEAKAKFLALESAVPNFKDTRRYLSHIDQDRQQAEEEAVRERTLAEQKHLRESQEKERAEEAARKAAEEERARKLRETQDQEVQNLAQKAYLLNEDILQASTRGDFKTAKAKFADLGQVLENLQNLKNAMMSDEEKAQLKRRMDEQAQRAEAQRRGRVNAFLPAATEARPAGAAAAFDPPMAAGSGSVEVLKRQEERKYQQEDFQHGVELYNRKKYDAAKIVFEDLAAHNDRRAAVYLMKIQKAMKKQYDDQNAQVDKERNAYLSDRQRQERKAMALAQKEISRQRQMAQDTEKKKQTADEDSQRQRIRSEAVEVQQNENRELDRKRQEIENKARPEDYEFRKLKADGNEVPAPPSDEQMSFSKVQKNGTVTEEEPKKPQPPALTKEERRAALELSKKRQKFLEDQYKNKELEKDKEKKDMQARVDEETRVHQEKLEAERRSIKAKFDEGVKVMYRNALNLYKHRQYKAAARKFQDIEDIQPNYRGTRRYLEKSKERLPVHAPAPADPPPPVSAEKILSSTEETVSPAEGGGSRDKTIRNALDLFDPNAK